jgi:hypothetical protein
MDGQYNVAEADPAQPEGNEKTRFVREEVYKGKRVERNKRRGTDRGCDLKTYRLIEIIKKYIIFN